MMSVFLTNAEYKNALAILRALTNENIDVHIGGSSKKGLCFFSRLPVNKTRYPSPTKKPELFKKATLSYLKRNKIDVFMPVGIDTFTLASKFKDNFEKYSRVPVVSYDKFVLAHDKSSIIEIASKLHVPVPISFTPTSVDEALSFSDQIGFPLVIKARKGTATSQVMYAQSKDDIKKIYRKFKLKSSSSSDMRDIIDYSYPLMQEYLPGDIYDVLVLFVKGKPRAVVAQKRILCYPSNGGSGALNITVDFPEIVNMSIKLMTHLKWFGVAMLEFKMDSRGDPRLLEVNPKFWGTSGLAIAAGVNFPYLLYKTALEGDVPIQKHYTVGKLYGWPFPMGVKHLLDSTTKKRSFFSLLKLMTQRKTVDIQKNDLKPLSYQLMLTSRSLLRYIKNKRKF